MMKDQQDNIVQRAREKFKRDKDYWQEIYERCQEDLDFLSDDKYAQWDQKDYEDRISTGRPALTIDQLGQFIHQVSNDIRMNTPSIRPIPANSEADEETADIYKGLIKAIEYDSNAAEAYDTAVDFAIRCGIGFIRVDHDYADDTSFDQKLVVKRMVSPLTTWLDCNSVESDGKDAEHCTMLDEMLVSEFMAKYPDANPVSFDANENQKPLKEDDTISVAEFFELAHEQREVARDDAGNMFDYQEGMPYAVRRTVKRTTVMRYRLSGDAVLEQSVFPGCYIPIIPVYGEEQWNKGKRSLLSLIRKSKDAQRMYNVWKSLETEIIMKQPQAPVMVAEGTIEDYAADWKNPSKSMALRYKSTDAKGNPMPPPQRLEPPTIPAGVVNASRETIDDIKATMGIYNASLGAQSNETSGVAINQRKVEGDVATFHFGDNLTRSVAQCGRVLISAAPDTYDASRIIQILGEDDEPQMVGVNGVGVPGQTRHYDLAKGTYSIRVVTGPAFTTQRQETVSALNDIFKANPQLMGLFGDIYFKNSDFAGAEALAKRAELLLPPQVKAAEQGQDPQAMAMQQQIQQMQQIIQQGAQEIQSLQQQLQQKQGDTELKAQKNQIDAFRAHSDAMQYSRELDIREADVAGNLAIKAQGQQIDQQMQRVEQSIAHQNTSGNNAGVQTGGT